MDITVFIVDFDFGGDEHEYLAYIIHKQDTERAEAAVRWVKAVWDNESEANPQITYDDLIEREFKKADIWFEATEYHVVWVNYYE